VAVLDGEVMRCGRLREAAADGETEKEKRDPSAHGISPTRD
jgi:hypothetical protein